MSIEKDSKWYVIHTKSGQEDVVDLHLSRLGLEILNPKLIQERIVWGCLKTSIKPLFAGYIFAKFNAEKYLHTIQYTRGVRQVLRFGMTLFPVEEEIIQNIQSRLDNNGCVELKKETLVPGSSVQINVGAFSGLNGVFDRETSDKKRVVILLDVMGVRAQVVMGKQFLSSMV